MAERPVLIADAITATTSFTADARTTALAPTPLPSMRARSTRAMSCEVRAVPLADVDVQHLRRPADGVGVERSPSEQSRRRSGGRAVDERGKHVVGARRDRDDHRMRRPDRHVTARSVATEHDDRDAAHRRQSGCAASGVERGAGSLTVDQLAAGDAGERSFGDPTARRAARQPVQLPRRAPPRRSDARCRPSPRRTSGRPARAGGGHPCPPRD